MNTVLSRDPWMARLPRTGSVVPYLDWLVHTGSLTARLRARCPRFGVRLLGQRLALPMPDERRVLGLRRGELAWVRQVLLLCGGEPVVFAHTVLPRDDVRGAWPMFAGLGARPLGELLFTDPGIRRLPFRYQRIASASPLWAAARTGLDQVPDELWARRSLFCRRGGRLLVTEAFLPSILSLP